MKASQWLAAWCDELRGTQMSEYYYLLSKDIGDGPHLIGQLTRSGKGQYQFRYMFRDPGFPHWFMRIPRMADSQKLYTNQEVLNGILLRAVPEQGEWAASLLMKQNGIAEYDEWALLESMIELHRRLGFDRQPFCDSHQQFYFYSEIPDNARRYD